MGGGTVKATPTRSRTPFLLVLLLIAAAGGGGIWYKVQQAKQPVVTLDATAAQLPEAEGYFRGNPSAPVTIVEFGDFECPQCARFALIEEPDLRARVIDAGIANFRYFDWPIAELHRNSVRASLAASCAADQGKFWEMHDALYAAQDEWSGQATDTPERLFSAYAAKLALDMPAYESCMTSQRNLPRIQASKKAGVDRGVGGTPTLFIGRQAFTSAMTTDQIKRVVDSLVTVAHAAAVARDSARK
jgi:protein-disulfide isomerase